MDRLHRWSRLVRALILSLSCAVAAAQQTVDESIGQAMQLSRTGKWAEAIDVARAVLARDGLAVRQRAEALSLLAACCRRSGDEVAAKRAIADFDTIAADVPADSWCHRSIADLRTSTPPARRRHPPADGERRFADVATEVWNVRQLNSRREHRRADDLARRLLDSGELVSVEQRCDLWMHRAYACTALGDDAAASRAFERFALAARSLPTDSRLPLEMALLRQSLELPALAGVPPAASAFTPPAADSYWQFADPAAVGVDAAVVDRLAALARVSGTDGMLVTRRGTVVFEWYSPLYSEPMRTMSSCKSITALLAGMLVDRGELSLDDTVGATFPAWRDGLRGDVTVRHLLTMTGGLARRPQQRTRAGEGWTDYALRLSPVRPPGARWEYSNESVQLLSPLLERAAGVPLHRFAREQLFEPIGATDTSMRTDRHGATNTFADAATSLRAFARFGELVRLRGVWPGKGRIVSQRWLDAMTTACPQADHYGYLWWLGDRPRRWMMRGYLDTNVWVLPDHDLVIARVQQRAYLHARDPFDEQAMLAAVTSACAK